MKILELRTFEIASAGFSGQVSVAKIIHISSTGSALVAIQLSRKLLLVLNVSNPRLFRSLADSFAHYANKLRQVNARAQAKVARACAQVFLAGLGYATGYL